MSTCIEPTGKVEGSMAKKAKKAKKEEEDQQEEVASLRHIKARALCHREADTAAT
jgi:hypothetical protein